MQVEVSSDKANPQLVDLAAALPARLVVASSAPPILAVDLARTTQLRKAIRSVAARQVRAIHSAEEIPALDSAQPTQTTQALALHLAEAMQRPLGTRLKAPLPLLSSRSPRKMALVLLRPALTRASQCSHSTRARASRS